MNTKIFKKIALGAVLVLGLMAVTNPNLESFEKNCPVPTEKLADDRNIEEVGSYKYRRSRNFLIFSIYEFEYVQVNKIRQTGGRHWYLNDRFGRYRNTNTVIRTEYLGLFFNFIEIQSNVFKSES